MRDLLYKNIWELVIMRNKEEIWGKENKGI